MEHLLEFIIPYIIAFLELIGVIIIFVSSVKTFGMYVLTFIKKKTYPVKQELASALALALEFKMGAEILILGSIIVLRALLSFLIHFELKG